MSQSVRPGTGVLVLKPVRRKFAALLVVSALLTGAGALGISEGQTLSWLTAIFFGICSLVFAVQLLPGSSYLKLTPEGFVVGSLFRKWPLIRWDKVSEFRVIPAGRTELVVFNSTLKSKLSRINHTTMGATNGFPDTYGMKADRLADLMNAWRNAARH